MSGALQAVYQNQRGFAAPIPAAIGAAYGGGYFAGQINQGGVVYNLVVSDQSVGQALGKTWGPVGVDTGYVSVINGPANSAGLAALGASYQGATFCEGLNTGGYTDWYLPAENEMGVMYYFLKPGTFSNNTGSGANANAVYPQPISTSYTSGDPAQTTATDFQTGGSQVIAPQFEIAMTSTEWDANNAQRVGFANGQNTNFRKDNTTSYVRAVRRVLA
jgi:hypothetical protein